MAREAHALPLVAVPDNLHILVSAPIAKAWETKISEESSIFSMPLVNVCNIAHTLFARCSNVSSAHIHLRCIVFYTVLACIVFFAVYITVAMCGLKEHGLHKRRGGNKKQSMNATPWL